MVGVLPTVRLHELMLESVQIGLCSCCGFISSLIGLSLIELGAYIIEQALGSFGQCFTDFPLAHGLIEIQSAGFQRLNGLDELISSLLIRHLRNELAFFV